MKYYFDQRKSRINGSGDVTKVLKMFSILLDESFFSTAHWTVDRTVFGVIQSAFPNKSDFIPTKRQTSTLKNSVVSNVSTQRGLLISISLNKACLFPSSKGYDML